MTPDEQELQDAANRMRDAVNMHVSARWASADVHDKPLFVAIRLDDGRSPDAHTLYHNRASVFKYNTARNIMAVKIGIEMMPLREAILVLQMNRRAFANGVIFSSEEPVTPQLTELMKDFIPNTLRKLN